MATDSQTKNKHEDLLELLREGDECDQEVFAEQRSNVLLINGDHWSRRQYVHHRRIRESKDIPQDQKIRLTKNHIQKITKTYVNNIISMNPGVGFKPKNESELQDQKSAELHHSVWRDAVDRYDIPCLIEEWADDFVGIGEVATKVFWDPSAGDIVAYYPKLKDNGEPDLDENGQPQKGEPVFGGSFIFETIHGFNLLRSPTAKRMKDSPWLMIRKMADVKDLQAKFPDYKDKLKESMDETFVVFDANRGGYTKTKGQTQLMELYYKPCVEYPDGYFFYFTKQCILAEGPLPGGIFPIVWQGFDLFQTTARARGPVKTMRPYQIEINRCASKIAEHHITLGDDKIILQNGTKVSQGMALPGVRAINVTGGVPTILNGRSGEQYLNTMNQTITELYQVMNVLEDSMEKDGQLDPFVLLFRAASQKKKFQRYIKRFERFLIEVVKTYLKLAKLHMPEEAVIAAIGRNEQINMAEFKNSADIGYEISVEAQSDDIETKLGKQMMLNHTLQYVGNKMEREDIGKIIRAMPYANEEETFNDLTLDYDSATNDILSLDRGETPPIGEYDNHKYLVRRLVARMRQADFRNLHPAIQQAYAMKISKHMELEAANLAKLQQAQSGFIPTGGYLLACDFYVADPKDPTKTRRARLPSESLQWLVKKLETQGSSLEALEQWEQGAQAQLAEKVLQKTGGGMGQGRPGVLPTNSGSASPGVTNEPRTNATGSNGNFRL